jgi:hypothetical protein
MGQLLRVGNSGDLIVNYCPESSKSNALDSRARKWEDWMEWHGQLNGEIRLASSGSNTVTRPGCPANLKLNELTLAHQEELYSVSQVEENRHFETGSEVATSVADIMRNSPVRENKLIKVVEVGTPDEHMDRPTIDNPTSSGTLPSHSSPSEAPDIPLHPPQEVIIQGVTADDPHRRKSINDHLPFPGKVQNINYTFLGKVRPKGVTPILWAWSLIIKIITF